MTTKSILVIEDNASNMKLIRALLEIGDYRVIEAVNAESGIDMARRYRPKLILMDISLPGMDGIEATEILKGGATTKNIPVIAVTAHATENLKEKASQVGCSGFIPKPLDTRTFLQNIERSL